MPSSPSSPPETSNSPPHSAEQPLQKPWHDAMPFVLHCMLFGLGFILFFVYVTLWLTAQGISPTWIGGMLLMGTVTRFFITPLFSELSDRFGQRWWVLLSSYSVLVPITGLMMVDDLPLWVIYVLITLYGGILGATFGTLESYLLLSAKVLNFSYNRVRGTMSLGLAIGAALFGAVFQSYGVNLWPALVMGLFVILWGSMWMLPRIKSKRSGEKLSLFKPLAINGVGGVIVLAMLAYMAFAPYMGLGVLFFVENRGFSESEFGNIMGVCILAESLFFFYVGRRVQKWRVFLMIAVATAITIVRFLGYRYGDGLITMMFFHAMHAFSFGIVHMMVMELYRRHMPAKHLSSATGLYDMFSNLGFGLGVAIGGYILEKYGVEQMINFTIMVSVSSLVIAVFIHLKRHAKT